MKIHIVNEIINYPRLGDCEIVISCFTDIDNAKKYIEKIANERKNMNNETCIGIFGKDYNHLMFDYIRKIDFKWNYNLFYQAFIENKRYLEFIDYVINTVELNKEYTVEEIDEW